MTVKGNTCETSCVMNDMRRARSRLSMRPTRCLVQKDLAAGRREQPGKETQERGLPRPVGTDHADELSSPDGEVQPLHDGNAAHGPGQRPRLQKRFAHPALTALRLWMRTMRLRR